MCTNTYTTLARCLGIAYKLERLSKITGISKATLEKIAKGKGKYEGCLSTQLRLQAFLENNQNRAGRPYKNGAGV